MLHKFTKSLAVIMMFVAVVLAVYTIVIGVRLWWCSFCVIDSREYMSNEAADRVYNKVNETRTGISNSNEYAKILCNASGFMRFFILLFEIAVAYIGFVLFIYIKAYEEDAAKRRARSAQRNRR